MRKSSWLLVPLAFHLVFSWIGFNPLDEGWSQAIARRMAEGELPHRDIILCRPALSHLLQVPFVLFGGHYALWLSRLWAWLTVGLTCWIWSGLIGEKSFANRYALYTGSVMLCAHAFSMMAWPSLDGMLLVTVGVLFSKRSWGPLWGGLALLCRQNFLFSWLALSRGPVGQRVWGAVWFGLPISLYLAYFASLGLGPRLITQLSGLRGALLHSAVLCYLTSLHFWAGLAFGLVMATRPGWYFRLFLAASVYLAWSWFYQVGFYLWACFALFGTTLALALWRYRGYSEESRFELQSGICLAWVVSISYGYNTPALASGILWLLLWRMAPQPARPKESQLLLASLLVLSLGFTYTRLNFPYHDRPAWQLTYDAGSVLPGAGLLKTNETTYKALRELKLWTGKFHEQGIRYTIFTDFAVHWMSSPQLNPLPLDTPTLLDLADNPEELARVQKAVLELPPESRILVQKFRTLELANGKIPLPNPYPLYYPQEWVSTTCIPWAQSEFFYVYKPPEPRAAGGKPTQLDY
ncbi:MAG: hypothetical protein U0931_23340 [Vulcanimicrobiota bacterium]